MRKGFFISFFALGFFSLQLLLSAQENGIVRPDVIRVSALNDTVFRYMVNTNQIYEAGLDTLPQMQFWRKIMHMNPDTGLISLAANRRIFCSIPSEAWDKLGDQGQEHFRDSIRKEYLLDDSASVLFTKGKNDFYDAKPSFPKLTGRFRFLFNKVLIRFMHRRFF